MKEQFVTDNETEYGGKIMSKFDTYFLMKTDDAIEYARKSFADRMGC